jgi:hypothetical protein
MACIANTNWRVHQSESWHSYCQTSINILRSSVQLRMIAAACVSSLLLCCINTSSKACRTPLTIPLVSLHMRRTMGQTHTRSHHTIVLHVLCIIPTVIQDCLLFAHQSNNVLAILFDSALTNIQHQQPTVARHTHTHTHTHLFCT